MEDEEILLCNTCTDLVSQRKMEAFPLMLLQTKRFGEWVRVHELCRQIGLLASDVKPELFAAWMPDPLGQDGYAIILFYDDETKWSMAAHYNRERLLGAVAQAPELSVGAAP